MNTLTFLRCIQSDLYSNRSIVALLYVIKAFPVHSNEKSILLLVCKPLCDVCSLEFMIWNLRTTELPDSLRPGFEVPDLPTGRAYSLRLQQITVLVFAYSHHLGIPFPRKLKCIFFLSKWGWKFNKSSDKGKAVYLSSLQNVTFVFPVELGFLYLQFLSLSCYILLCENELQCLAVVLLCIGSIIHWISHLFSLLFNQPHGLSSLILTLWGLFSRNSFWCSCIPILFLTCSCQRSVECFCKDLINLQKQDSVFDSLHISRRTKFELAVLIQSAWPAF